jgi:hypothetical protein
MFSPQIDGLLSIVGKILKESKSGVSDQSFRKSEYDQLSFQ